LAGYRPDPRTYSPNNVRSRDHENRSSYGKKNENVNNLSLRKCLNGPSENHGNQGKDGKEGDISEKRLSEELDGLYAPEESVRTIVHSAKDISIRNPPLPANHKLNKSNVPGSAGFLSCEQLGEILHKGGISMTRHEVELLSTGFSSDGHGNINTIEFIDTVQTILYNQKLEKDLIAEKKRLNSVRPQGKEDDDEDVDLLLINVCEGMLDDDLNGLLTSSTSLKIVILSSFKKMDNGNNGYISYRNFAKILDKFKSKLDNSEILKVALRYEYIDNKNQNRKNENGNYYNEKEKMKKDFHGNKNENMDENLSYEEYINNFKNNEISGIYVYINIYVYMHKFIYACTCIFMHPFIYISIYLYLNIYMNIHIHIYIYKYIYI
jgi:Ca2+-binding EF-hand superfamily protein